MYAYCKLENIESLSLSKIHAKLDSVKEFSLSEITNESHIQIEFPKNSYIAEYTIINMFKDLLKRKRNNKVNADYIDSYARELRILERATVEYGKIIGEAIGAANPEGGFYLLCDVISHKDIDDKNLYDSLRKYIECVFTANMQDKSYATLRSMLYRRVINQFAYQMGYIAYGLSDSTLTFTSLKDISAIIVVTKFN